MAMTFGMTDSQCRRFCSASLGKLLMSQRFRTSARQRENGFVRRRIVSSRGLRRNNSASNISNFNEMGFGAISGRLGLRRRFQGFPDGPAHPQKQNSRPDDRYETFDKSALPLRDKDRLSVTARARHVTLLA
jgi:hypothetical protein